MKIISSGIIRNEKIPRVGVISQHSVNDSCFDAIHNGIDLSWEEFEREIEEKVEKGELTVEEAQQELDCVEFDTRTVLFGDAWEKDDKGKYFINKTKSLAAVYSSDSGNITVEFSKHVKLCHHTSPCYVMADGSGPCADLDTPGNSVIGFTLPDYYLRKE